MTDFEQRLKELEDSINDAEVAVQRDNATMPASDIGGSISGSPYSYVYIIAAIIPLLVVGALFFAKPKWVTKKVKGKRVICWQSLIKWASIITVIGWSGLFLVNYCGVFAKAQEYFGK
uniref:Membrane protein n=1 Tax=Marseillevirus LCMAC201 TaxID=2506605 RepID=A0A481YVV9_9VIRU|nr:MAG: membrane protein [Marseillevirus LCMAC201]